MECRMSSPLIVLRLSISTLSAASELCGRVGQHGWFHHKGLIPDYAPES